MADRLLSDQKPVEIVKEFMEALDDYKRLTNLETKSTGAAELTQELERARTRCRKARRTLKRWPLEPAADLMEEIL